MKPGELAAARSAVETMSDELRALNARRDQLLDERRQLFVTLVGKGVQKAELARWAGVTQQAVAFAIEKASAA